MNFISNPFAPPGFDGINANTADYISQFGAYPFETSLTANQNSTGLVVQIDHDSDFHLHAIQIVSATDSNFTIMIYDNYSRKYVNKPVQAAAFGIGTIFPFVPYIPFPAQSFIGLDLQDQSGAPNDIKIIFYGERIYKVR